MSASRVLTHLRGKTLSQLKASGSMPESCFSIAQLMRVNDDSALSTKNSIISKEQINKLCLLSRVSIKEENQLEKLTKDVNNIVLCLDILQQAKVPSETIPMYSPMQFYKERNNRWREDIPTTNTSEAESIARRKNLIQGNTLDVKAGYFIAPKVK
ncbi:predicted protein [Naegleria gruberi]|uniref:Predicted protein n=1 Tax=Naegleria gruberi TaxID=5762 RepID=D2V2L7_NAEGR|nr:uncharacterized protein NAEGRDRAFT_63043 [Naegleria gruberi]EFC49082.1 predicted protein [Naegleria gruberi]|eukprot:XP_002681826.1 predicted protein [Naegleria gruberi strain NEG-M]